MSSFIFNEFKKRYLEGKVPSKDTWHFIPVNDTFKKVFDKDSEDLSKYRTISDFSAVSSEALDCTFNERHEVTQIGGKSLLSGNVIEQTWYKMKSDGDLSNKPMYITTANYTEEFCNKYGNFHNLDNIQDYLNKGGFYLIRSKDELTWFADRANTGNNTIIGVLSDNIEGELNNDPIGKNEEYPFQGILDGNGYTVSCTIKCNNADNGLVGVLGTSGIVQNFNIANTQITCEKKLNLTHLKEDGRDINAGVLVGRNYGLIKNIKTKPSSSNQTMQFTFSGFVPEVYSVTNKSDKYSWSDGKVRQKFDYNNENYFYLNSWCINSPGNVCPYVGYFAEGYYGEDAYSTLRLYPPLASGVAGRFESTEIRMGLYTSSNKSSDGTEFTDVYCTNILNKEYCLNYQNTSGIFTVAECTNLDDVEKGKPPTYTAKPADIIVLPEDGSLSGLKYYNWNFKKFDPKSTALSSMEFQEFNYSLYSDEVSSTKNTTIKDDVLSFAKSPVYYGVDSQGYYTCGILYGLDTKRKTNGTQRNTENKSSEEETDYCYVPALSSNMCYNTNLIAVSNGINEFTNCPSAYCQTSLRMNNIARAAYNVGIIAGANFGDIENVVINTRMINNSNFVGFLGTVAGKHCYGNLEKVNVQVNYALNYKKPESVSGDNSYNVTYRGTPLLPNTIYSKIKIFNKNNTTDDYSNLRYLFSAYYESENADSSEENSSNNKKETETDHIKYDLHPIFVAGGLFGRYIPVYKKDDEDNLKRSIINDCKIQYKDNFKSSKNQFKRIENSFGALIGKVDYSTDTFGLQVDTATHYPLQFTNCTINAQDVGKEYVYTQIDETTLQPIPSSSAVCKNKYVGVYELKYNPINSMQLTYGSKYKFASVSAGFIGKETDDFANIVSQWKDKNWYGDGKKENAVLDARNCSVNVSAEYQEGSATCYTYATDYAFSTNYMKYNADASFWQNANLSQTLSSYSQTKTSDFRTNLGLNYPYGLNKNWLANLLILFNNCESNVSPAIILYDDYCSYNYNNSSNFAYNSAMLNDNTIFKTRKCWSAVSGEKTISGDVYNLTFNDSKSSISGFKVNPLEVQGIQNTFDGYTFIDLENRPIWCTSSLDLGRSDGPKGTTLINSFVGNKFSVNNIEGFSAHDKVNGITHSGYNNPRKFIKNVLLSNSVTICPVNYPTKNAYNCTAGTEFIRYKTNFDDVDYDIKIDELIHVTETSADEYYYYTYDNKLNRTVTHDIQPLTASLTQTEKVEFSGNSEFMGYVIKAGENRSDYYKNVYSLGNTLEPSAIRKHINAAKSATTSSILTDEYFGGFYVIDNSGNNVMYLDNVNETKLNGNVVATYPASAVDNKGNLLILEVK